MSWDLINTAGGAVLLGLALTEGYFSGMTGRRPTGVYAVPSIVGLLAGFFNLTWIGLPFMLAMIVCPDGMRES